MNSIQANVLPATVVFLSKGKDASNIFEISVKIQGGVCTINKKQWMSTVQQNLKIYESAFAAFKMELETMCHSKLPKKKISMVKEVPSEYVGPFNTPGPSSYKTIEMEIEDNGFDPNRVMINQKNENYELTGQRDRLKEIISQAFSAIFPPKTTLCCVLRKKEDEYSASTFACVRKNNKEIEERCKLLNNGEKDQADLLEKFLDLNAVQTIESDDEIDEEGKKK